MATLKLNLIEPRMMRADKAAEYTGLPRRQFQAHCPVRPVEIAPGHLLYDRQELDRWIDGLKAGANDTDQSILDRL